jgi:NADPH:quinone reductase-like Zn-dependent oxidoreductase
MQAVIRERWGGIDVLELRDIARPTPRGDEVLVRVEAASVNRADLDLLGPDPAFVRAILGIRAPRDRGFGCDVAGVVEAVGPEVTRFRTGDRVFGDMYPFGLGSFAGSKCAPERAFLAIPDGMSFEHASTLPHAAILAIQGLRRRDGRTPGPGDRVLIGGASGNVGPFAVQIAKAFGAEVTGVCSAGNVDFVRSLGADHVIDYGKTDYTTTGERYDWILDVHCHHSTLQVRKALRREGVYITLGGPTTRLFDAMVIGAVASLATKRQMGLMLWWKPFDAADIATLADLYAAGKLVPAIDRRYPLAEAIEALRYVDEGHPRGKVIITG